MIHPMRVLVTGASGRVGRAVVDSLLAAGVPVRALTHRSEAPTLPANVEVVTGDLTVPESLDAALRGVGAVFLVWTAPPASAPAVVERLAAHARRVVFLSSPHQTPHPFFQQPNPMAVLHAEIERLIAATGLESTIIRPGMFASNTLFWWAPAIRADGVVRWPYGAAETAPVDDRDVAAVAARTLSRGRTCRRRLRPHRPGVTESGRAGGASSVTSWAPDQVRGADAGRVPQRDGGNLAAPGRGHAARRLGRDDGTAGVRHLDGVRHPRTPARTFRQWVADHATAFTEGAGLGLGRRPVFDDETGEVVPMATSRQWVVDTLRHLGFTQAAEDALRDLPEEIDAEQLREFGDRHGIGSNMLTDRMGGSP